MMTETLVRAFCVKNPLSVSFDAASKSLLDVYSGKPLALDLATVVQALERTASDTGERYLLLVLADGRQVALARAGIAFPPDPVNSGPIPLPPVVCWRDFRNVERQVAHVLGAHPGEMPG